MGHCCHFDSKVPDEGGREDDHRLDSSCREGFAGQYPCSKRSNSTVAVRIEDSFKDTSWQRATKPSSTG